MQNENEFELEGKTYVAVENEDCCDCVFLREPCVWLESEVLIPPCSSSLRKDEKNVFFKEKQ